MWPVASTVADLSAPLAGMPPVASPANIYADDGAGMLSPAVRGVPYRIYVPNSGGSTVTVIDPSTYRVIGSYQTGLNPQHVVPGYDLRTLYATNDLGNSLSWFQMRIEHSAHLHDYLFVERTRRRDEFRQKFWWADPHPLVLIGLLQKITKYHGELPNAFKNTRAGWIGTERSSTICAIGITSL